ncbi:protein of unknown function DUF324 [Caldithrix abyssi DSM 13497]|uniref:CRISPR/Cas system CSM-associated protein Csm3, group 7 of RAMP superfamily n=1 Tax=Caldithrix abyssi DSM 13497 TaxID=880073 RepID=H1XUD4_CALAY|nr:RAMP superfamily CRISPR-associated protein [Caldithrix abyssi]APF18782.1 CRISPR/Cas system CSM-associated protein Csm3, group 7 of RAMP superfamily [Caldithrix abyssi DSM 13497]EHO42760.1 protein of unknown function DUF324 [Caldithrix abyssi DSM 13497]
MSKLTYKIDFFSDWHMGTGLSSGSDADLLVIKDKNGLPFIPGKTLKGLFKDAAKDLLDAHYLDTNFIREVFGVDSTENSDEESIPGKAFFSNAELSDNVKKLLKDNTTHIYRRISSTAIEKNGQAKEHSLRTFEVTVPLTLYATIENIPASVNIDTLIACMKMIKRIGTGRNRGFGRCEFSKHP